MKSRIVNIMKPMVVFISPNATTRSSVQEFLKENWPGEFRVFSTIKNKSIGKTKIDLLFVDLSSRFLMDINDLNFELSSLNVEAHFFYDDDVIEYFNRIKLNNSASLKSHCKPKEAHFDFIQIKLIECLSITESKFALKLNVEAFDLKRVPDLISIGTSTGGPDALVKIIKKLGYNLPPILIVLHIAPRFIEGFCRRLQSLTSLKVIEFRENQEIRKNSILVASGKSHMTVQAKGSVLHAMEGGSEKVNGHCPSVDILFDSISELKEHYVAGALLTGMGKDGARGLLKIRNAGGLTIAQDELSSAVYGMPKEAKEIEAAQIIIDLEKLSRLLMSFSS
jgi:chemotaxis response regulator CheB